MIQFLIKTFIKNHEKTEDRAVRTAYGNLACIVSVVCVLVELWIFKRKKWF